MKNWIVTLLVLVLPVVAYWGLKNNKDMQVSVTAHAANKPTVIKFASPMCTDCKKIKVELDALKPLYQDRVDFIEINATDNAKKTQEYIDMYGVTVVPTVIFLDTANQKERKIEGFETRNKLEQCIKELING